MSTLSTPPPPYDPDGEEGVTISHADVVSAGRSCQAILLMLLALSAILCVVLVVALAI